MEHWEFAFQEKKVSQKLKEKFLWKALRYIDYHNEFGTTQYALKTPINVFLRCYFFERELLYFCDVL